MSANGTLIYDGECSLCVVAATWLGQRGASGEIVDGQRWLATPQGASVVSRDEIARSVWWVEDGRRLEGARAVAQALIALGGGWRIVGRALATRPVAQVASPVYRFVARHRRAVAHWWW